MDFRAVENWLNTPVIVIAVLAVAGALWGILRFVWFLARWTAKVDTGERDFRVFAQETRGETGAIKGETERIKGETAAIKGETGAIKGETERIKGETERIKGETAAIKGETERIKGEIATIKGDIATIKEQLTKLFERVSPQKTIESDSPMRLSDLGKRISEKLEAVDWAAQVAPSLVAEVATKKPFQIDQFSEDYVESRLDDQWTERVAEQAYEFGVTRGAVRAVLRVVLRDELLRRVEQTRT